MSSRVRLHCSHPWHIPMFTDKPACALVQIISGRVSRMNGDHHYYTVISYLQRK